MMSLSDHLFGSYTAVSMSSGSARVVLWLDHSDGMCSRAWRTLCSAGSRFNSSCDPGKAHPPT